MMQNNFPDTSGMRFKEGLDWNRLGKSRAAHLQDMLNRSMARMKRNFNSLFNMKELDPSYLADSINTFNNKTGFNKMAQNPVVPDLDYLGLAKQALGIGQYWHEQNFGDILRQYHGVHGDKAYPGVASGMLRPVGAAGFEGGMAIQGGLNDSVRNVYDSILNSAQQTQNLQQQWHQQYMQNLPRLDPNILYQGANSYRNQLAQIYGNWGDRMMASLATQYQDTPWPQTMAGGGGVSILGGDPNVHAGGYYEDSYKTSPDSFSNKIQQQNQINERNQMYNDQLRREQEAQAQQNEAYNTRGASSTGKGAKYKPAANTSVDEGGRFA